MIALEISQLKDFMNKLLCTETFDKFLVQEITINGVCTWNMDGRIDPDFYTAEEREINGLSGIDFIPYGNVRTHCYNLIRGKQKPSYFKFVLLLSPTNLAKTLAKSESPFTPDDITGCFVNMKFQNGKLIITTGISYRIFSVDKSFEKEWDSLMKRFLTGHEIAFEEM